MKKNSLHNPINILLLIIALQGCSASYYGHVKEDWNKLSEDERMAIKKEYQVIVDSKKKQSHKGILEARTQSIIDRGVEGPRYR